jgi:hypothetical protein
MLVPVLMKNALDYQAWFDWRVRYFGFSEPMTRPLWQIGIIGFEN